MGNAFPCSPDSELLVTGEKLTATSESERKRPRLPGVASEPTLIVPGSDDSPISPAAFINHLRSFGFSNPLKKASLAIIAGQLTEEQIKKLRGIFVALDVNGDGYLTAESMKEGMQRAGVETLPDDLEDILANVASQKGSTGLDYNEFLAAALQKKHYLEESVCWKAFDVLDRNSDGQICREDLESVLNAGRNGDSCLDGVSSEEVEEIMQIFDNNGDNCIDFEDFMLMMLRNCSPKKGQRGRTLGGMKTNANLSAGKKPTPTLAAGVAVRVHSLVKQHKFNGQAGVCKKWLPGEGRWLVHLDGGVVLVLKAENLDALAYAFEPSTNPKIQALKPRSKNEQQLDTIPGSPTINPMSSPAFGDMDCPRMLARSPSGGNRDHPRMFARSPSAAGGDFQGGLVDFHAMFARQVSDSNSPQGECSPSAIAPPTDL